MLLVDRKKVSKVDPSKGRHIPLDTLGQALIYQSRQVDQPELLSKMGETQRTLGEFQTEFVQRLKATALMQLEELVQLLKDYQQVKKKLTMRRLDYDAKLNKMQKSKKEKPEHEEELQSSQIKYESSLQTYQEVMWNIQEKQSQLAIHVRDMMEAQKEYHQQCLNTLSMALPDLQIDRKIEGSDSSSTRSLPPPAYSLPSESTSQKYGAEQNGSDTSTRGTRSISSSRSGSLSSSLASMNVGRRSSESVKKVRAIFPFHAEQEDELSIEQGDSLEILNEDDDGWWIARNSKGTIGMIPSNYVELLSTQGDNSQPQAPQRTSIRSSSSSSIKKDPVPPQKSKESSTTSLCTECSCDDYSPNVFKPGSCNNCFHKHR